MLRKMMLLATGASAMVLSTAAAAVPIVYAGSQQVGSVLAKYTITTDGKIGALTDADVTGFDVTLSDSLSTTSYGRTTSGGTGSISGNFSATATGLTIPAFLALSLSTNATNSQGGVLGFLSFRYTSTYLQVDDAAHNFGLVQTADEPNRTVALASVVTAVPEAAAWAMMMVGLGVVGGSLRRRQKVITRVQFA